MPWEVPATPGWPTKLASGSFPAALGHSIQGMYSYIFHRARWVKVTPAGVPSVTTDRVLCSTSAVVPPCSPASPQLPVCSPLLSHLVLGTDMGWLSGKGLETTPTACALCITHSVCSCFPNRDEGLSAWTKTSAPAVSGCSPRVFPAGQAPRPAPKILNHKAIQVPAYP